MQTRMQRVYLICVAEPLCCSSESITTLLISYCCCSVTQSCPALCNPMDCSTAGFPVFHYLPEFAQTHIHWVSDAIQPFCPLSLPLPVPSIFPGIKIFSQWVCSFNQVTKVLEFQHQSFQWTLRIDFFRTDWFDLLAVQETLKDLLQHHSLKASILQHSAFFMVQFSYPYMTIGKP